MRDRGSSIASEADVFDTSRTADGPVAPGLDIRELYLRLVSGGLSAVEAGNLTAHVSGLRICRQGWSIEQLEHLQFLRSMVDSGRLLR